MKVLDTWADNNGRMTIAKVEMFGRKIAIVSAYAPNKFDKEFYSVLTQEMLQLTEYSFIVGADMNAVWQASERSSAFANKDQEMATAALQAWVKNLGLIDIWRAFNPTLTYYSFFSARHKTSSRIDFLFFSPQLFQNIYNVTLLPMALSDHKGVFGNVLIGGLPKKATRWRFNSSLLGNESYKTQFNAQLQDFIDINLGSVEDPRILWNAVKGFIRSNATLFSSNMRKARTATLQNLEAEFTRLDLILQTNYSRQIEIQRDIVKKEINNVLKQQSEFLIHRTRQKYYFHGSRPSHLLASTIRTNDSFADIPSIRLCMGNITTDPKQINETIRAFYSKLYQSEIQVDSDDRYANFLDQINLPKLQKAMLQIWMLQFSSRYAKE